MEKRGKLLLAGCTVSLAAAGCSVLQAQTSIAAAMASRGGVQRSAAYSEGIAPPSTLEDDLRASFRSADVIFTGEVIEITHSDSAVVITWHVEDAVRGAQPGGIYELREWPGLWDGDSARYTVGQRALVMLHAPSAAGYASPVSGGDGIVALRGNAQNGVLDSRLLAQHAVVTDAARLRPLAALRRVAAQGVADGPTDSAAMPVAAENYSRIDAAVVLGMLHAWQRESQRAEESAR